jgi:hypothetical protein
MTEFVGLTQQRQYEQSHDLTGNEVTSGAIALVMMLRGVRDDLRQGGNEICKFRLIEAIVAQSKWKEKPKQNRLSLAV